jgi:ribosome maturation protein Sdo1
MTRGGTTQAKVYHRGSDDDFIVFVDDIATYKKWLGDKSTPMPHFVSSFNVFVTHKQGIQGQYDGASKATLENEFGTHVDEEVIKAILEKGTLQESEMVERQGSKNDTRDTRGARIAHISH